MIIGIILGTGGTLPEETLKAADLNGDGVVDVGDCVYAENLK